MQIQKMSKPQAEALQQIILRGGVIMSSEWTTGSGRYIKARAVPPNARRYQRGDQNIPHHAQEFFLKHPKVKAVIAVDPTYPM